MLEPVYSQTYSREEPPDTSWQLLAEDVVRTEHELPWLRYRLAEAVERLARAEDIHDVKYWSGVRDTLTMVINQPADQLRAAAEAKAAEAADRRKEQDNARRVPTGAGPLERLLRGVSWWSARG